MNYLVLYICIALCKYNTCAAREYSVLVLSTVHGGGAGCGAPGCGAPPLELNDDVNGVYDVSRRGTDLKAGGVRRPTRAYRGGLLRW